MPCRPARTRDLQHFTAHLFAILESQPVRYCLLHSESSWSPRSTRTLHLVVHPRDGKQLPLVVQRLKRLGYQPVQWWAPVIRSHRFVFAWIDDGVADFSVVEVMHDYCRLGLTLATGAALMRRRVRRDLFWAADPAAEFIYLLSEAILTGDLPCSREQRLRDLARELGAPQAEDLAGGSCGPQWASPVVSACIDGSIGRLLPLMRKPFRQRAFRRHVWSRARNLPREGQRWVQCVRRPAGMCVALLGPDGSGKTSLIHRLFTAVPPPFSQVKSFYWRPRVLWGRVRPGPRITEPHSVPPRGWMKSVMALFAVVLDYWAGCLMFIRPGLGQSTLLLFERYCHDMLIDPLRYRYGGPLWLLRVMVRLIPSAQMIFLVLDAEEAVIYSRKREVPPEELNRQVLAYREFARAHPNAVLVRTDQPEASTYAAAVRAIVQFLAARFERRYGEWLNDRGRPWGEDAV